MQSLFVCFLIASSTDQNQVLFTTESSSKLVISTHTLHSKLDWHQRLDLIMDDLGHKNCEKIQGLFVSTMNTLKNEQSYPSQIYIDIDKYRLLISNTLNASFSNYLFNLEEFLIHLKEPSNKIRSTKMIFDIPENRHCL